MGRLLAPPGLPENKMQISSIMMLEDNLTPE